MQCSRLMTINCWLQGNFDGKLSKEIKHFLSLLQDLFSFVGGNDFQCDATATWCQLGAKFCVN